MNCDYHLTKLKNVYNHVDTNSLNPYIVSHKINTRYFSVYLRKKLKINK